jgi:hypothetical protein
MWRMSSVDAEQKLPVVTSTCVASRLVELQGGVRPVSISDKYSGGCE